MLPLTNDALADAVFQYKVKRNGKIIRKKSDEDQSFFSVPQNRLLRNLPGSDNFSYAQHDGKRYKYIVDDGMIGDFRKFGDSREQDKENLQRAQDPQRIRKGKKQVGNIFTVTDAKVGDEIFRLLGGNSNVEFGQVVFENNQQNSPQSQIWSSEKRTEIDPTPFSRIAENEENKIKEVNHSHPFDYNIYQSSKYKTTKNPEEYSFITKYPSGQDMNAYKNATTTFHGKKAGYDKNTQFSVYSSWSPNPVNLPFKMEYNDKGLIGYNGDNRAMETLYENALINPKK